MKGVLPLVKTICNIRPNTLLVDFNVCRLEVASFPVPCPAFRCLQYGKAGRGWYIYVIDVKGRKIDGRKT